jgi:hypothetical protein
LKRLIDKNKLIKNMNERAEADMLEFRDCRDLVCFAPEVPAIEKARVAAALRALEKYRDEPSNSGVARVTIQTCITILETYVEGGL